MYKISSKRENEKTNEKIIGVQEIQKKRAIKIQKNYKN